MVRGNGMNMKNWTGCRSPDPSHADHGAHRFQGSQSRKRNAASLKGTAVLSERAVFHLAKRQRTQNINTTVRQWVESICS